MSSHSHDGGKSWHSHGFANGGIVMGREDKTDGGLFWHEHIWGVEKKRLNQMFGLGRWVWHSPCPGLGVAGAFHHINHHRK